MTLAPPQIIEPLISNDNIDPQLQSPLFGKIPAEIRNQIFELALQEYEDSKQPYKKDTYYYRPGFRCTKRVDVDLLRICKRTYVETRFVPVLRNLELSYYAGSDSRAPPEYRKHGFEMGQLDRNLKFKTTQWSAISRIRIFPQMYALEALDIKRLFRRHDHLRPTQVTITLRYADWWFWEDNVRLELNINTRHLEFPASVKKVVMELETREGKLQELEGIVQGMLARPEQWTYSREDGAKLQIDTRRGAEQWKWDGPTKIDGATYPHHPEGDTMVYIVKVLTWVVIGESQ
ncbi:hypothetical protein CC78DRAFT_587569 [Lojkania enalia]|uniref:Uncharacterized protein n=1 Tax=Lojkania enalia TaxID=147567 RepID=A0A9P4N4B5_9PLEO|nr:hypothetical protein CC78DRAFT_587569 [Didymosphaeria enalia]